MERVKEVKIKVQIHGISFGGSVIAKVRSQGKKAGLKQADITAAITKLRKNV